MRLVCNLKLFNYSNKVKANIRKIPKKKVVAKKTAQPPKKHSSHRLNLTLVLTVGVGMLVVGYTIGISLGFNVGSFGGESVRTEIIPTKVNSPTASSITTDGVVAGALSVSETLTDEQVVCLKKALGLERYTEVASNLGKPTLDEQAQIAVCTK